MANYAIQSKSLNFFMHKYKWKFFLGKFRIVFLIGIIFKSLLGNDKNITNIAPQYFADETNASGRLFVEDIFEGQTKKEKNLAL